MNAPRAPEVSFAGDVVRLPPTLAQLLDQLVKECAASFPNETPEAVRRIVELSVLKRGIEAVREELQR